MNIRGIRGRWAAVVPALLVAVLLLQGCVYMKMNPPADADKAVLAGNNSCWLATAANMLAGAGYGTGASVQARADDIYADLTANFGTAAGGWADTALTWWLSSANNIWPANPYTVVTVYGNKSPKFPWNNANGAQFIANELRSCNFVGLSISWPTNAVDAMGNPIIGSGGHAITSWGDNNPSESALSANPGGVRLTDSDRDTGGDVQAYTYDLFTNPNPGGANEGNGWYFNYDNNHPYLKHIVTLSPTLTAAGQRMTQKVVGSYRIHQSRETAATDLHYDVGTDVDILTYKTKIDWLAGSPTITESTPRRSLTVDWDFTTNPAKYCTWVTITTEFVLPSWNAIWYRNVRFTYPPGADVREMKLPSLAWEMKTPLIENASKTPNVTGGHVVGAFDLIDPNRPRGSQVIAEYRFVHEYGFTQNPEDHTLTLSGEKGLKVANLRFGHSYGYPSVDALWQFEGWMTRLGEKSFDLGERAAEVRLDWKGRLPYPEGEDIKGRIPELKEGLMKELKRMPQ